LESVLNKQPPPPKSDPTPKKRKSIEPKKSKTAAPKQQKATKGDSLPQKEITFATQLQDVQLPSSFDDTGKQLQTDFEKPTDKIDLVSIDKQKSLKTHHVGMDDWRTQIEQ